jgi:ribosomal protein S18 acetylase RimI-like enzyme
MNAVRHFQADDFEQWLPLWNSNNQGHENNAVTENTWLQLISDKTEVNGLGAFQNDRLLGLLHYILHPVTGHINPVCYMQDLYVDETARRQGIAKSLVSELARLGREEQWPRIYWLAEENNIAAQSLYKNLGVKLNFSLHILPLTAS